MSELTEKIHCICGFNFVINTWKHPARKEVHCSRCHTPHSTSFWDPTWKPNKQYWEERSKQPSRSFTIADMRRLLEGH